MICRTTICFTDSEMIEYYKKKRLAEIASLQTQKIHNRLCQIHYTKKTSFMVYIGTYDCYENIKI